MGGAGPNMEYGMSPMQTMPGDYGKGGQMAGPMGVPMPTMPGDYGKGGQFGGPMPTMQGDYGNVVNSVDQCLRCRKTSARVVRWAVLWTMAREVSLPLNTAVTPVGMVREASTKTLERLPRITTAGVCLRRSFTSKMVDRR